MNDLSLYFTQKDEVARLNKQINMMADFYHNTYKGVIKKLTSKVKVQQALKGRAIESREAARGKKINAVTVLVRLKKSGAITISDKDIAKACFTTTETVTQTRFLLKKES